MLSSAATHTSGSLYDPAESSWRVAAGTRILDQGTEFIAPDIAHVPTGQELTLTAASTPAGPPVTVSSKVSDEFTFTVSAGDAVVPILRPRYVPPTGLDSTLDPGPVSYRLSFDNLGPLSARVKTASLEFSLNGRSWTPARLTRLSKNSFRVTYHSPAATRRHRAVSLRVAGADSAGRTVREEVTDAYLTSAARTPARQATAADARRGFDPDRLCRTTGRTTYSCFVTLQRVLGRAGKALTRGWGADELRDAYGIPDGGADTTVGVVIAHDYPHAERDLNHYRARFGLPPCTTANGCFRKINQRGEQGNYPTFDPGWSVEGALDLQMVSAACPTCSIVLAEANQPTDKPLNRAIAAAINAGATVTNHSYGRSETTGITDLNAWYSRPGVTAVAASGDSGFQPATFPASSPDVVAVGGTTLARSLNTPRGWTERAWTNAGSGCSAYFAKPGWQSDPSCHNRSYADLSAAAFNIDIFVTSVPRPYRGWLLVGGTSASSPLVAGLIGAAGADGMRPDHLYADSTRFVDITHGSNGYCQGNYLCTAGPGFDGPTGWGTPRGLAPFQP